MNDPVFLIFKVLGLVVAMFLGLRYLILMEDVRRGIPYKELTRRITAGFVWFPVLWLLVLVLIK